MVHNCEYFITLSDLKEQVNFACLREGGKELPFKIVCNGNHASNAKNFNLKRHWVTMLFKLPHLNCGMGYHHKYEISQIFIGLKVYLRPIFLD